MRGADLGEFADAGVFQMGGVPAQVAGVAVHGVSRGPALHDQVVEIRGDHVGHTGATRHGSTP